ncbi:hypothetical protein [Spirosoma pollinicola]|uniref:DUF4189 domain-containing protein n=1 Tax=Spirosoma pollinicola TaxID=2057025 RepID=A0A2K8Z8G7_9BACT|nr:hypothetical protein [Spirosoma pollinicola]AUD06119.1 hypothetical protein CWM47_32310 [Spirosoma pollinicola]
MKKIVFSSLLVAASWQVKGQAAVYVCSENGAWGSCYGYSNVTTCAYNKCINEGGRYPQLIVSTNGKGYGAVAIGRGSDGRQIVGAAVGYSNLEDAKERAMAECRNRGGQYPSINSTWYDR